MQFFVPIAGHEAERTLAAIGEFVGIAPPSAPQERIASISWEHNGKRYLAEVGRPIDPYFGGEVVAAILDGGRCYSICTASRGMYRGGPIYAGKIAKTAVTYFSA